MKIAIYTVEERTTGSGKQYKSLTIQREGSKYPDKYVTVWSDFPGFNELAAGQTIEADVEETDSSKVNPNSGKPYKNKTLKAPGSQQPKTAPQNELNGGVARIINKLDYEIMPALKSIIAWQEKYDIAKKGLNPTAIDEAFEQRDLGSPF